MDEFARAVARITLLAFAGFPLFDLKAPVTWNYAIGFALVTGGGVLQLSRPLVMCAASRRWARAAAVGNADAGAS